VEDILFYGSPWQPYFGDWAFNLRRGPEIRAKWDAIPEGTDILITHGPPLGHGDRTVYGKEVGCADLMAAIDRIRPKYHVFGHIHEAYGISAGASTTFVNASNCGLYYSELHPPVVFDYLFS
jgi:Icc-related predicted phosphoesterase